MIPSYVFSLPFRIFNSLHTDFSGQPIFSFAAELGEMSNVICTSASLVDLNSSSYFSLSHRQLLSFHIQGIFFSVYLWKATRFWYLLFFKVCSIGQHATTSFWLSLYFCESSFYLFSLYNHSILPRQKALFTILHLYSVSLWFHLYL